MQRLTFAFVVPLGLAALGATWMWLAVQRYERITGREFYGLAGYHYSVPSWGFAYHPDGERIEEWTVTYPLAATSVALTVSALMLGFRNRRSIRAVLAVVVGHLASAGAFFLVAAWVSINVTGVFI